MLTAKELLTQKWYHESLVRVKDQLTCIKNHPHMVVGMRHVSLKKCQRWYTYMWMKEFPLKGSIVNKLTFEGGGGVEKNNCELEVLRNKCGKVSH